MTIAIEPTRAPSGKLLPSLAFYLLAAPIGLALFVGAFAADLFAADDVLFLRGLKLIALAALVQVVLTIPLRKWLNRGNKTISIHHQIATVSLAIGLNMTFLIVVPVTLDRSVSVFLLGVMNERPSEIFTVDRLETVFDDVYVRKYGAMDRRIKEQLRSGNITPSGEGFKITDNGRAFIRFSNAVATLFHLNPRYINPQLGTVAASN